MILKSLWVLLISMVPVIELRGGIPVGTINLGLSYPLTITLAVIGNLLPIPFLILYGRRVLEYFAKFGKFGIPFRWILSLGEKKVAKMKAALFFGIWLFVAIPLPGTGAWTGALIAITLKLKMKESLPAITLGVLTAASIVTVLAYVFQIFLF
ncbi:MAG: small multi-drug export protein [Eubacteriales bacterium]|nr:small multi-drug export protein [Eubacteriales bacterium]